MNKPKPGPLLTGIVLLLLAAAGAFLIAFSEDIFPQNMFGNAVRTVLVGFSAAALVGSFYSFKNAFLK